MNIVVKFEQDLWDAFYTGWWILAQVLWKHGNIVRSKDLLQMNLHTLTFSILC